MVRNHVVLLLEARVRNAWHDCKLLVVIGQRSVELDEILYASDAIKLATHDDRVTALERTYQDSSAVDSEDANQLAALVDRADYVRLVAALVRTSISGNDARNGAAH